jgi:hypothetical protein
MLIVTSADDVGADGEEEEPPHPKAEVMTARVVRMKNARVMTPARASAVPVLDPAESNSSRA